MIRTFKRRVSEVADTLAIDKFSVGRPLEPNVKRLVSDACLRAHRGCIVDIDYSPPAGRGRVEGVRLVAIDSNCVFLAPAESNATSPYDHDAQPFLREHIGWVRLAK